MQKPCSKNFLKLLKLKKIWINGEVKYAYRLNLIWLFVPKLIYKFKTISNFHKSFFSSKNFQTDSKKDVEM